MKRLIRNIIFMAVAVTSASACHFLEVEQVGKSDIEGYFSEPEAVPAAIYGLSNLTYGLLDKYLIAYPEIAGDGLVLKTTEATWDLYQNYTTTADDEVGAIGYLWKNGYQVINNANQIIDHVPALVKEYPGSADELNTCAAQALFIRAYAHMGICLAFGQNYTFTPDASHLGICVITHALSLSDRPSRQTGKEVYGQIVADLEESLTLYPENYVFDRFLPSPLASEALLARVYLYMGEWEKAAEYASKVIAKTELTKRESYVAMFNAMKEPARDEMIYTLNGQKQGSSMYKLYWKKEPKARPSSMVRDLLPEGDIRIQVLELDGEMSRAVRRDPVARPHPHPVLALRERHLRDRVRDRLAETVRQQIRRTHLVHELLVNGPASPVIETLGFDEYLPRLAKHGKGKQQ